MATLQINEEMLHYMRIISEDENLLKRAAKYLRKLVAEKKSRSYGINPRGLLCAYRRSKETAGQKI